MSSKRFFSVFMVCLLVAMLVGAIIPGNVLAETSGKTVVLQVDNTAAVVNGENVTLDVAPYIDPSSGRTLVPLRFVSESLGYTVFWDAEEKAVRVYNKIDMLTLDELGDSLEDSLEFFRSISTYKYVKLTIGSNIAETCDEYLIGEYNFMKDVTIDQAAIIKDGRTMVPVRFISEQMGLDVGWDGSTRKITITSQGEGYVPELIEAALNENAGPYSGSDFDFEQDPAHIKSQQPENYLMKIGTDGLVYYIDLAVKSSGTDEFVLSGEVTGMRGNTACFGYALSGYDGYWSDGIIKVTDEGFVVNYTNENGEKCSITFPKK
ncbi:MAG TPA: copper amine oxidase N-terminal domain-containing protein [Acetivibrio sp.]|nr:copper amine oxidase N-terminal domain-containing protein [Acetivibrio sp.]